MDRRDIDPDQVVDRAGDRAAQGNVEFARTCRLIDGPNRRRDLHDPARLHALIAGH